MNAPTRSASLFLLLSGGAPPRARPMPGRARQTSAEVEERRRVEILGEELEAQKTGSAPAVPLSGDALDRGRALGLSPAASKVYQKDGLSIGGYGETVLTFFSGKLENGTVAPMDNIADTLRAVLYVGYKFNDWLVLNSEFEFEHAGFSDEHAEGEAIVEFVYLDFLISKAFNIRAGNVLLPVGFINELHEPPTFLGAYRPALESEGGLIPTTWHEIGVGFHGELPLNLNYRLYLVNGLNAAGFNAEGNGGIGGGRQDGHQAIANKFGLTARLDWHPLPGLLVGASFYGGDSQQTNEAPAIWTTMVEAHLEFRSHGFQGRAIYARVTNSGDGLAAVGGDAQAFGTGTVQSGGYVEAGFDVLSLVSSTRMALIPFVWAFFLMDSIRLLRSTRRTSRPTCTSGQTSSPSPGGVEAWTTTSDQCRTHRTQPTQPRAGVPLLREARGYPAPSS
jgi:hypothetical protein